jgi:hypothetical protein
VGYVENGLCSVSRESVTYLDNVLDKRHIQDETRRKFENRRVFQKRM